MKERIAWSKSLSGFVEILLHVIYFLIINFLCHRKKTLLLIVYDAEISSVSIHSCWLPYIICKILQSQLKFVNYFTVDKSSLLLKIADNNNINVFTFIVV
jgi:hypothetical protein